MSRFLADAPAEIGTFTFLSRRKYRNQLSDNDLVSFLPMEDLGVMEKTIIPVNEKPLKEVAGSYTYFAYNDVLLA